MQGMQCIHNLTHHLLAEDDTDMPCIVRNLTDISIHVLHRGGDDLHYYQTKCCICIIILLYYSQQSGLPCEGYGRSYDILQTVETPYRFRCGISVFIRNYFLINTTIKNAKITINAM